MQMSKNYQTLVTDAVLNEDSFVRAIFSGAAGRALLPWKRVVVRPVSVKRRRHIQFSYFDEVKDITKNYHSDEVAAHLQELLDLPFKSIHVESTDETVQVHINAKGKATVKRHRAASHCTPDLRHDREKQRIISAAEGAPFLKVVGIMNADGTIKADRHDKFVQINEFLKLLAQTGAFETFTPEATVTIVDFGCGNAYLTFALYYYLTEKLGLKVNLTGVDLKEDLLRRHRNNAEALGWDGLRFEKARIQDYVPDAAPDVVVALHACDTATDDAIAHGILRESQLIVTAPCCQHHLQAQLGALPTPMPFGSVWRDGILSERLGDLLTDTLRAQFLRKSGYKTDVVQFVADAHTPKNLMIRAVKTRSQASRQDIEAYEQLKSYWGVTPYIETVLDESMC